MGTRPSDGDRTNERVIEAGSQIDEEGPALRKVQDYNNDNTIVANITDLGRRYHGLSQSDPVRVDVREHGIWIEPIDADEILTDGGEQE